MRHSESIVEVSKALVAAATSLTNPKASGRARVQTKQGGSYEYRYPQLHEIVEDVRATLALHDLVAMQEALTDDHGRVGVVTRIQHASGEWLEMGPLWLPGGGGAQDHGSAITYARRYALTAALLLAADEDDDGSKAPPVRPSRPAASGSDAGSGSGRQRPADPDITSAQEGVTGESDDAGGSAGDTVGDGDSSREALAPSSATLWEQLVEVAGSVQKAANAINKANGTRYSNVSGKTAADSEIQAALDALRGAS